MSLLDKIKIAMLNRKHSGTSTPALEMGMGRTSSVSPGPGNEGDPIESLAPVEAELARLAGEQDALISTKRREEPGIRRLVSTRLNILGVSLPLGLLLLLLLPAAIVLLAYIPWPWSSPSRHSSAYPVVSNGTHDFHPTTLIISLDGFRKSYLDSHPDLLPDILALARRGTDDDDEGVPGLRAESMQPQWPTLTFPNHWSIMTGLHPESHGIVANHFYDPEQDVQFKIEDAEKVGQTQWWKGEPMWSVAERAGMITANLMWPGPPVTSAGVRPTHSVSFDTMDPSLKTQQILEWIDLPLSDRPQLIFGYVPEVDHFGHLGGPDSEEVEGALRLVNGFVKDVVAGLDARNLSGIVNLLLMSDHGMAATSNDRLVFLDDVLGQEGYEAIEWEDGWPSVGLRFKEGTDTAPLLDRLRDAADKSNGSFSLFTREEMPERWHFRHSDRIAPIWMVPKLGWAILSHEDYEGRLNSDFKPKGIHGYDNQEPDMQAIFFMRGPFVRSIKDVTREQAKGSDLLLSDDPFVLRSFSNLEVFSLIMRMLDLDKYSESPLPAHNGTSGFWDDFFA